MGFMCPRGPALDHPFAETLLSYAENGCRVDYGDNWSKQQIEEAVHRGPHKSAREAEAAAYAWEEAQEKVNQGYCSIYKWEDIKHSYPP